MFRKSCVLILALAVCLFIAGPIVSADDNDGPVVTTEETTEAPVVVTTEPTTEIPTVQPTTEETTEIPTVTEPTTEIPTVQPTTEETTEIPTVTEPTTEIPTVTAPTTTIVPGSEKGYIDVYCNVEGAYVYFDGTYEGVISGGLLSVEVSTTGHVGTITVAKSGYTTWSGSPPRMPDTGEHVSVTATLSPITPVPTTVPPVMTGNLYAQSSPGGAAIYLNNNFKGYAPLTITGLSPATYTMKAVMSGYVTDTSSVTVNVGQTSGYYPVLSPAPYPVNYGTVYVTSSPTGALVYVDGDYYGRTPMTVYLSPGSHDFDISSTGYEDYETTVYVAAGQSQNLPVSLSTGLYGKVIISSNPQATVYMDSSKVGTTNAAGILTLPSVTSGSHLFRISATGYYDWMNTIYIRGSTTNTISATLTPEGSGPQQTGSLAITSTPSNAEVYVDSLFRGYTPMTLDNLVVGQHTVQLSMTGYMDYYTTATVTAGQTTSVPIALSAAPTPTPTKSPGFEPVLVLGALAVVLGTGWHTRGRK